jgi:hypothetical protein
LARRRIGKPEMNLGIIAEDDSDVAVIRELTLKLLGSRRIKFKRFIGHGCGKLRRKCRAWAENLVGQGCRWLAVVHDLDVNDERQLREELTNAIASIRSRASVVLIPRREIEAWLLFDKKAIATAFNNRRCLRLPGDPESLDDPKRFLRELIRRFYGKDYLSSIHNGLIAKHIDIQHLRRSHSFAPHPIFVSQIRRDLR